MILVRHVASWLILVGTTSCSGAIPKPPSGPAVREAGVLVPYPPPVVRVETIPPQKDPREVWVSGQWDWDRGRYRWIEGHWRVPPADAYFTPWSTRRRADGSLVFWPAGWRTTSGRRLDEKRSDRACPPDVASRP